MSYRAVKIPLSCDEMRVRRWSDYMLMHMHEVFEALRQEGVRHEAWYLCRGEPLCVIGIMDVVDASLSRSVASNSTLSVDQVHRDFKRHWVRSGITMVPLDPANNQPVAACELHFEARV